MRGQRGEVKHYRAFGEVSEFPDCKKGGAFDHTRGVYVNAGSKLAHLAEVKLAHPGEEQAMARACRSGRRCDRAYRRSAKLHR